MSASSPLLLRSYRLSLTSLGLYLQLPNSPSIQAVSLWVVSFPNGLHLYLLNLEVGGNAKEVKGMVSEL